MFLRKLELRAFGCFVDWQQLFHSGFNLITGTNGSGKSTLSQAILRCLFTSTTTQKGMARYQPWDLAEGPAASLDFKSESGKEITVSRDWGSGEGSVTVDTRQSRPSKRHWESILKEEIGVSDESVFAGTVFVAQDQLESSLWEPHQLADAIERLVLSSGKAQTGEILDRLDKERRSLRVGLTAQARTPGPIAVLNGKLNDLQIQLDLHEANKNRYDHAQRELKGLRSLHGCRREKRDCLAAEVRGQERKLTILAEIERLSETNDRIDNVVGQVEALDEKVRNLREERDAKIGRGPVLTFGEILGLASLGLALILLGLNLFMLAASSLLNMLAGLFVLASILILFFGRMRKKKARVSVQNSMLAEISNLEEVRENLLEGRPISEFIELQLKNRQAVGAANKQLGEPEIAALPFITHPELEARREKYSVLTRKTAVTAGEIQSLEGMISVLGESAEFTLQAREKKLELETEKAHLLQRTHVYALTHDVISLARNQAMQGIMGKLEPVVSSELDFLTQGRYPEIQFDAALKVKVQDSTHDNWIAPSLLSAGTRDQVNLAIRLGLMALLFEHHKLPLFLDDPLVRFDASRRAAAGETLKQLSLDRQVFYFSHSTEFRHLADHVIELEPVAANPHS